MEYNLYIESKGLVGSRKRWYVILNGVVIDSKYGVTCPRSIQNLHDIIKRALDNENP